MAEPRPSFKHALAELLSEAAISNSERRPKPNINQDIQSFEDEVKKMKEKTEAKLQQSLQELNAELSQLELDHKQEIISLKQHIFGLKVAVCTAERELNTAESNHRSKVSQVERKIEVAQKDLDGFRRTSPIPTLDNKRTSTLLDKEFECPVCFEIMGPPKEVFQCPSGHLICGDCKTQGSFIICHVCRTPLGGLGNFTRSRPMERIIRTYLEEK